MEIRAAHADHSGYTIQNDLEVSPATMSDPRMTTKVCGLHDDQEFQVTAAEDGAPGNESSHEVDGFQGSNPHKKQTQMSKTLKWLDENYERAEGVCLPRCILYTHYQEFCKKEKFEAVGAATFGKLLRQRFPRVTTRRLGTRGQSKYHYYGIGIKETSQYYQSVYNGKGLTRFSGAKVKTEGAGRKYSLSSKTGTLLPDFPDARFLNLPENVPRDKMETLMLMYRTHCQRIIDAVVSANFYEVKNLLLHFWQGMPDHLSPLLDSSIICDVIPVCDDILYQALLDTIIPSTIQDIPESLATEIKIFAKHLPGWMIVALEGTPEAVVRGKLTVLKPFIKNIKGQLSFIQLAQTTRQVLMTSDTVSQMHKDLSRVDISKVCVEMGFQTNTTELQKAVEAFASLKDLLSTHSTVEDITDWLDVLLESCLLSLSTDQSFQSKAACFLLMWSSVGSVVVRDLTLCSAPSFGSLHLLHMMLSEYIFLIIESPLNKQRSICLRETFENHLKIEARRVCTSQDTQTTILTPPAPKKKRVSRTVPVSNLKLPCVATKADTALTQPMHIESNPDARQTHTEKRYHEVCTFYHPMNYQFYPPQYTANARSSNFWQEPSYERPYNIPYVGHPHSNPPPLPPPPHHHSDPHNPLQSYEDYDFMRRPHFVQESWSSASIEQPKGGFYPTEGYPRSTCFSYGSGNAYNGAPSLSAGYVDVAYPQNTMMPPAPRSYGPVFQEGVSYAMPASHF